MGRWSTSSVGNDSRMEAKDRPRTGCWPLCLPVTWLLLVVSATLPLAAQDSHPIPCRGALDGVRHRVVVSTDIGGTDPDDFQSMVHLLLYADLFDIEGLISSPYGPGRAADILTVIECYAADYGALQRHSTRYPAPEVLRSLTRQGETEVAPDAGFRRSTDGSRWLIECARREDPRPLHVLVWGGLEDLAQALHDAPEILPHLRVHWIGGPNKKWSPHAYQYIAANHPTLWMIENNSTYRGFFVGGKQEGDWGNQTFVTRHVAEKGALGRFFTEQLGGVIKMGDTPTVTWLLKGDPDQPTRPSWGGRFIRAWERPYQVFQRMTTRADEVEQFSIVELQLPVEVTQADVEAHLVVENQRLAGYFDGKGNVRFRFSPKACRAYRFVIDSQLSSLDGLQGGITAVVPPPERGDHPSLRRPNWWTDDPTVEQRVEGHVGARTVSRWRVDFLADFAARMNRVVERNAP